MTGPEHYREAERLLFCLPDSHGSISAHAEGLIIAEAQVHATLALAAAVADGPLLKRDDWDRATGRLKDGEPS